MSTKSMEYLLQRVGSKLATLRINKGYATIKSFVAAFNLPNIQYWRLENGKTNPTLFSLHKLLKIHKMTVQDFFCEIEADEKEMRTLK